MAGDVDRVLAEDRVVVMAEWSRDRDVRSCALRVARAYAEAGWPVLIVAARDPWKRLRAPSESKRVAVVSGPNSAYDFGSWRDALVAYPQIASKDRVVLTNDSLEGPAGPLDELLRRIESTDANVWGVTLNPLPLRHLHSFLLTFTGGVLAWEPLRGFFAGVAAQPSNKSVTEFYELGLTAATDGAGLSVEAGWTADELGVPEATLNHHHHRRAALLARAGQIPC